LSQRGYLKQFGDFDHREMTYAFGDRSIKIESIISRRPHCACDHGTRTTICRLYPLMPAFDVGGRLTGIDTVGTYEVLEKEEGLARACRVDSLPFEQMAKFISITALISADPKALFYILPTRARAFEIPLGNIEGGEAR
jgi:hypothetical protein